MQINLPLFVFYYFHKLLIIDYRLHLSIRIHSSALGLHYSSQAYCFFFISKPNDMINFSVFAAVFQSYAFSSSESSS